MKRFLHTYLRFLFVQLLLLAGIGQASAQDVSYSSADGMTEHWYVIRFNGTKNDKHYAIKCNKSAGKIVVGEFASDTPAASATDDFLWKLVEAAPNGEYYMVSKSGRYVSFDGTRFTIVAGENGAVKVHLVTNGTNWEIQREGVTDKCMNAYNGLDEGHDIRPWNKGDGGNVMKFDLAEEKDNNSVELYLQFSAYGRCSLYDDGTGTSPVTNIPGNGVTRPDAAGFTWTKTKKGDDYILCSGHGRYLAVTGDALTFTDEEGATPFKTPRSPYYGAITGPTYTALRCAYTTANGKAIAINPADGSVTMADASTATRATVIRETQEIDGIEPPVLSGESNPVWYNITFTATGDKLALGGEGTVAVTQGSNPFDLSMMWSLEKIDEDKFYLKSHEGGYLAWDGDNSCFTATGAKATPAMFRLSEADPGKNSWVLHYVDATGANQYLQPSDAKDKVVLAAATDLAKARVTFKAPTTPGNLPTGFEHTPQEMFYSDETHEHWYVIRFFKNTDYALKDVNGALELNQKVTTAEATDEFLWKLVPSDEAGWYHIVSKTKKYITYLGIANERRFGLDTNVENAAKLRLIYNANNTDKTHAYAWQIQHQGSEQSMNALGGVPTNRGIGEYGTTDTNNVLLFDLVEEADINLFLQFSSYGRRALYDDNGTLTVKQPAGDVAFPATDPGYTWTKSALPTGGYTLRSGHGNYIALSSDGNSLDMTADKSRAATFRVMLNPYGGDMNVNNLRPVNRFIYVVGTKALSIDVESNQVVLTDIGTDIPNANTPAGRATLIRETHEIDGADSPIASTGDDPVWYNLTFTNAGGNLTMKADGSVFLGSNNSPAPAAVWCLEKMTTGTDLYRLKNFGGKYLQLNGTTLVTTDNEGAAATFRLNEYAEAGADRDKWVLQCVDADGYQYLMPATDGSNIGLTPAATLSKSPIAFTIPTTAEGMPDVDRSAQQIHYSKGTNESWYILRFCENKDYAIKCDGNTALRTRNYSTASRDELNDFTWKFIPSEKEGWYYMVSKSGKYVKRDDRQFNPDADKANATKVRLVTAADNKRPNAWQIQSEGSDWTMHPQNGIGATGESARMVTWYTSADGNALLFDLIEEPEADLYFQFSSYGREALYDNGTAPVAQQPAGGETRPAEPGYLWTKTRTERGWTLKSDKGNYIAANADGSLALTTSPDAAAHFATLLNPYTEDVAETGGRSVSRFMFSAKGKLLSIDPASGSLSLINLPAAPARSTILRETTDIDGVKWPKLSTEAAPVWYDIRFSNEGNNYLSAGNDGDKTAFAEPKTVDFNPALLWRLEDAGNDLVRVKGYKGTGYLAWSGSAFTAKADEAGAALFRVDEYAETGTERDKWVLHYVGATDANQYLKPNDAKDKVVLAAADALRPAALFFEEKGKTADVMNEARSVYFSTSDARYWYVIRFRENKNLVLRCDDDMPRVGSYPADSPAADAPDNMKWKLEVSDKGEYYLVSKNGRYIYYADNRFRTTTYQNAATQLHLIYNTGNAYPYAWQIQCWGSGYSLNPNNGLAEGNEMAQGETTHRNGALLFEPAEDFEAPLFLQFSSYGRLALYDTGKGNAPEARLSIDDAPTDLGFTWVKTRTIEDGYTLRSGNGNYIALNDDGTGLVMTDDATRAVTIHTKQNPYAENVFDSGQRLVHRKMYYIGDKNTENKAITVDPANGSLSLTAITPATRATVIRETTKIDAGELPQLTTDESPVWYNILFTRTGDYLSIGTDADKLAVIRQSDAALDPAMMWRLETGGSNPDEFFLKNRNGDYLRWDAANSRFNTTTVSTEAAPFRLAEYIENGPDRDKWVLHYVAAKDDQAWNQYLKPADDKNSVGMAAATDPDRAAILFKKMTIDRPDYCTTDSTDWRRLYFYNAALALDKGLHSTTGGVNAATVDNTDDCLWKNVKNEDGSVSLKNWDGQYLALNAGKTGFTLTADPGQAAKFTTEKTDAGGDMCTTWLFTDNETGKVLGKDADNNIVLMDKGDTNATAENINFFLGEKMNIPTLNPQPGEYYTIALNGYMHDGFGDTHDARRGSLPSVQGESMVVTNDYLWAFIPKDGGYMLRNRNGNYLTWGTDGTFDISAEDTNATILALDFIATRNANATWNVVTRMKPLGGTGINDAEKNLWFNFTNAGPVLATGYNSALSITKYVIYEPEDYTAYKIIPKRSWFIKQVEGQDVESNSFIHATEDGSYGMKKFALKNDLGQLTGDSIKRQNTNDYRVVRYMKRNTTREFRLPTSKYGGSATQTRIRQYQRWYNYDTDGLVPDSLLFLNKPAGRNYSNGTLIGEVLPFNGQTSGDKVTYGFNFKMPDHAPDDFEYTLGIDMSFYTDFVGYFGDNEIAPWPATAIDNTISVPVDDNLIEPTLAQRCIYVVRNAHIMAKELTALSDKQSKWLEEYNIAFPAKKVNFRNCSLPLDNELANYWIYRDSVASEENLIQLNRYANLEFKITNNDAGIYLDNGPIVKGATGYADPDNPNEDLSQLRFFRFRYPTVDGKEQIPGGSTADIEVYAKDGDRRYRLAVYHLTFVEGTELRPHAQIIGMKDDGTGHMVPKSDRSPRQLRRDLGEPKAGITFDFSTYGYRTFQAPPKGKNYATKGERDAGVELPNTYRFPLLYENTSYAFEPTAIGGGFNYTNNVDENAFGAYTIARTTKFGWNNEARFYPVRKYYHDAYPDEEQYNYEDAGFLYIDASECPGRMASLAFDGNICKGTRITVSAWVSSPNSPNRVATDVTAYANVFFNILGYYTDKNGVEHEEKIYTYCPGPISGDYRVAPGDTIIDGDNIYLPGDILKSESGRKGVWQQIYFSFIPRSEHIIERFVLNVNNGCTSSAGGDILIDDIEVYSATPTVKVTNTLPVCNSTITLTQIEADYETMMNALGLEDKDLTRYHPSINYCVVDSAMYRSKLEELLEAGDPAPANNAMRYAAAGDIRRVTLNSTFKNLPEYSFAGAVEGNGSKIWKLVSDNGAKQIVISDKIISNRMQPNKTYYLAAYFTYSNETVDFSTFQVGTECSISSLFTTRSSYEFVIDGDNNLAENGGATVCAGSNITLNAKFRGVHSATGEEMLKTLPCDWWLGYYGKDYARAYINADGSYTLDADTRPEGAVSVREALESFRVFYPNATTTTGCTPKSSIGATLTQPMIDGLTLLAKPATTPTPRTALLLLYRKSINVQIPDNLGKDDEYIVTLQPIQNLVEEDEDLKNCVVCFNADTLSIRVNGHAPNMLNGFSGVDYPSYMTNVPVRLTLAELDNLREGSDGLRLPLREIEPATPEVDELVPVTLTDGTETYSPVYITATDDPVCNVFTDDGSLTEVGRVKAMSAVRDATDGHVDITLLPAFTPREGYTYTLRADYREKEVTGKTPNTCNGSFVFDLKIVPRYAVWTAAAGNAEWTNDRNWRRADRSDLQFGGTTETDYPGNEANGTDRAFVPLSGTSAIIAHSDDHHPALYAGTFTAEDLLDISAHTGDVTQDIQYDMLVSEAAPYVCRTYRTNTCDGLVLQSRAELTGAQHLSYQKAWMEYEVDTRRWYTLGSPLQQTYAGEWYAPTNGGREDQPYFHPITYNTGRENNRFRPAVYQRGWAKSRANLYYLKDPDLPGGDPTNVDSADVAVLAEWSSVFNDVNVRYDQSGFSIRAEHPTASTVLFRLPKEDTAYEYYQQTDTVGGDKNYENNSTAITRTEGMHHRLWTDKLKDTPAGFTITLTNDNADNLYYLVSNPFPCGMDLNEFFKQNTGVLESKYWLLNANGQGAAIKDETSGLWTTVNLADPDPANRPRLSAGQGFFVKAKAAGTTCNVTYTPGMMVQQGRSSMLQAPARRTAATPMLRIRAERDGLGSEAVVTENERATDAFLPAEDMETLVDQCLTATPVVYTLAGTRATTVNSRRTLSHVGLGITGQSDDNVTLTFTGMNTLGHELLLLDTRIGELTPLTTGADSLRITVPGRSAGRYFLVTPGDGDSSDEAPEGTVSITARNGQVTVKALGALTLDEVQATAPDGRVHHHATPRATTHHFTLAPGIYLITARTTLGTVTRKIAVK